MIGVLRSGLQASRTIKKTGDSTSFTKINMVLVQFVPLRCRTFSYTQKAPFKVLRVLVSCRRLLQAARAAPADCGGGARAAAATAAQHPAAGAERCRCAFDGRATGLTFLQHFLAAETHYHFGKDLRNVGAGWQ